MGGRGKQQTGLLKILFDSLPVGGTFGTWFPRNGCKQPSTALMKAMLSDKVEMQSKLQQTR